MGIVGEALTAAVTAVATAAVTAAVTAATAAVATAAAVTAAAAAVATAAAAVTTAAAVTAAATAAVVTAAVTAGIAPDTGCMCNLFRRSLPLPPTPALPATPGSGAGYQAPAAPKPITSFSWYVLTSAVLPTARIFTEKRCFVRSTDFNRIIPEKRKNTVSSKGGKNGAEDAHPRAID